jgi:hypothetical protein
LAFQDYSVYMGRKTNTRVISMRPGDSGLTRSSGGAGDQKLVVEFYSAASVLQRPRLPISRRTLPKSGPKQLQKTRTSESPGFLELRARLSTFAFNSSIHCVFVESVVARRAATAALIFSRPSRRLHSFCVKLPPPRVPPRSRRMCVRRHRALPACPCIPAICGL